MENMPASLRTISGMSTSDMQSFVGAVETSSQVKTDVNVSFRSSAHCDSGSEVLLLSERVISGCCFGFTMRQNLRGLFLSMDVRL